MGFNPELLGHDAAFPATISGRAGLIHTRPRFDFRRILGLSLKNIWQISLGPSDQPDVLYCGVEPAALFESHDAGETWSLVRGLFDHPHRPRWMPGNGGLSLHTILPDPANPERMYVAISAGGVYRTDDGGRTWTAQNRGIRAMFVPNKYPEFGQCVPQDCDAPCRPERLFLQNHWGFVSLRCQCRKLEGHCQWRPVGFWFRHGDTSKNPDWVCIVPVESDQFPLRVLTADCVFIGRAMPAPHGNPSCAACRKKELTRLSCGDAMTADSFDPVGIYLARAAGRSLVRAMKEGRGKGISMGCHQWYAYGMQSSSTPPVIRSKIA